MRDWWEFVQIDALAIFAELSLKDLQYPVALIAWIVLVSLDLLGVERRDHIAGMSYTVFCTAAAVFFFLAMPGNFTAYSDIALHVTFVSFVVGITSYRWFHRNENLIIVSGDNSKKKKKQEAET
jgi:multisubunit Na+/H+ antiporter MnhF subunit